MDPTWLLVLLPLAVTFGWLAARRARPQPRQPSAPKGISETYFRSINFLANDQHDKALDVLAKALEDHDESLEIQLALGTLFRRRGEIEKATQIHQSLISRPGLRPEQKSQVLFELANDYFKAGLLDRSENLLLELGAGDGLREPALRLLIQIYESEREWESAIAAASRLDSLTAEACSPVVAQYHCE
ncbi:MAG TPA: lipopolysaccharide assembly protein LapB, partial [Gammaproteobacteria bacterium]|nr:lipopolysaccharide assembly protein LapB [Gammaproteobacteria bacterium]